MIRAKEGGKGVKEEQIKIQVSTDDQKVKWVTVNTPSEVDSRG